MSLERAVERAEAPSGGPGAIKHSGCWKYAAGIFLILLVISHLVRWINQDKITLREDQHSIALQVIDAGAIRDQTTTTAYTLFEADPSTHTHPPTLILLHGSPMPSTSMMALARQFPDSFEVLVPDLPGFGRSSKQIPDYSIEAHAHYLNQLMDSLHIAQAHLVAYSMSGGVALHLYEQSPQKVQSIVMLSAIGVQELELLGSYPMNHAVHGLQLALLWGVQELVPHMGFVDNALLNTSYARNFYDSDQRPLRNILNSYASPMLIMHGNEDKQVPVEVAYEHHRIVPQSRLVTFEGGHGLVFNPGSAFVDTLSSFIHSVENNNASTRAQARSERIAAAATPFNKEMIPQAKGLTLMVYMLLIALATLVTEDGASIGAGLLVAQGTMSYISAVLASLAGIVAGDVMLFLAGKYISKPLLDKPPFRWFFSKDGIESASRWVSKRGAAVIIASRFIPGSRLPTYVAAGSLGLSIWKFLFYFIVASILWTPMLVWFAVIFGEQLLNQFLTVYETYAIWIFLGLIAAILLLVKLVVPLFSHEGRRTLIGAWRRKINWEFWPMWAFYPPIVLYVLYLGFRYRSLTLFTGANPAIDMGGLVGESKSDILNQLAGSPKYVARYTILEAGQPAATRLASALDFIKANDLEYPVIIKPDTGERGKDVFKATNESALRRHLETHSAKLILQEYAPGPEFGVFYYRLPDASTGEIFSITSKQFPVVSGNGKHTLRRLILDDERAVCMAQHYFKANNDMLFDVLYEGEKIQLIDIGTHSRGSIFLDGMEIYTPALHEVIESISQNFEGFYFGRFDIRTPSIEEFKEGKSFKIVELNGVSSEATHIYDPKNSLFDAYRILREQWRIAFEIGDQNRKRGVEPASLFQVMKRIIAGR